MTSEDWPIDMLRGLLGDDFDPELAKKALAKHNGNLEAAAAALLDKENFDDETLPSYSHSEHNSRVRDAQLTRALMNTPVAGLSTNIVQRAKDQDVVIDLTGEHEEDPELNRAIQLSMEGDREPVFRRSDRAPNPNWAVVPSNIAAPTAISSEDQSLAQAIEASLNTSIAEDKFEELYNEHRIRHDRRPVAIRSKDQSKCYSALLLQSLFFVPQIRTRISKWIVEDDGKRPTDLPEILPFTLLHLFTYMEFAVLSYLVTDDLPACVTLSTPANATDVPGDLTSDYYKKLVYILEVEFQKSALKIDPSASQERIFHLRYAPPTAQINNFGIDERFDTACVRVEIRGTEDRNDLVSCLSVQLGLDAAIRDPNAQDEISERPRLFQPSEVIAFNLTRVQPQKEPQGFIGPQLRQAKDEKGPFRYPRSVYLDQFLNENAQLAAEKRLERKKMYDEVESLAAKREILTHFEGQDVLKNLEGTLFYYEKVAAKDGGPDRLAHLSAMVEKLRNIIAKVKNELQALDDRVTYLRHAAETIFDDPSIQRHRYDLRAVLVHDGLYGRNHIYSYVNDGKVWWKTLDLHVSEVSEETVLTDSTGLHLGSGPYMLLYSRAVPEGSESESLQWPSGIQTDCREESERMLSDIPRELVDSIRQVHGLPHPDDFCGPSETNSNTGVADDATMDICA